MRLARTCAGGTEMTEGTGDLLGELESGRAEDAPCAHARRRYGDDGGPSRRAQECEEEILAELLETGVGEGRAEEDAPCAQARRRYGDGGGHEDKLRRGLREDCSWGGNSG